MDLVYVPLSSKIATPVPTKQPTPTINPTHVPSIAPSIAPTQSPSMAPSIAPTQPPSNSPSIAVHVGGGKNMVIFFVTLWLIGIGIIPYFSFKSYIANNKTLQLTHQRITLFIGWIIVYAILPTIILKLAPVPKSAKTYQEALIQFGICGFSIVHNLRVMELLFYPNYYRKHNVTTPIRAIIVFVAWSAEYHFKDFKAEKNEEKFDYIEQIISHIRGCLNFLSLTVMDAFILRLLTLLYWKNKSFIDSHYILFAELNMIFALSLMTYAGNMLNWLIKLIYGDRIDITPGYDYPVLSHSIRNFWCRQSRFQRESLHNCVYKPVMKYTNNNTLIAALFLFIVNWVLHSIMALQLYGDLFSIAWFSFFVVAFISVYCQIVIDRYLKQNHPKFMESYTYKICQYIAFHLLVLFMSSRYCGVYDVLLCGVQNSEYLLTHWTPLL